MERQWSCFHCMCEGRPPTEAVALDGLASVCLEHLVDAWAREFSNSSTENT